LAAQELRDVMLAESNDEVGAPRHLLGASHASYHPLLCKKWSSKPLGLLYIMQVLAILAEFYQLSTSAKEGRPALCSASSWLQHAS
jgi:hypothetical protein